MPRPAFTITRSSRAEVVAEGAEDLEDLVVVVHVEGAELDPRAPGWAAEDLVAQLLEPFGTPRAEREVVSLGGELAGHLGAEPGGRAGDQDGRHAAQSGPVRDAPWSRVVRKVPTTSGGAARLRFDERVRDPSPRAGCTPPWRCGPRRSRVGACSRPRRSQWAPWSPAGRAARRHRGAPGADRHQRRVRRHDRRRRGHPPGPRSGRRQPVRQPRLRPEPRLGRRTPWSPCATSPRARSCSSTTR